MKWFRIRKANIDPSFREFFEERAVETMRAYIAIPAFSIRAEDGSLLTERQLRPLLLIWLKEQYDRAERKETWLITMEAAITIFVLAELVISIINFACRSAPPRGL